MPQLQRILQRLLPLWAAYAAVGVAAHALMMFDHAASNDYRTSLLTALCSDVLVGFVLALLSAALPRLLAPLCVLAWILLMAANREYALVFDSNIRLSDAGQGMYKEFILGSVMHSDFLPSVLFLLVTAALAYWLARRLPANRRLVYRFSTALLILAATQAALREPALMQNWKAINLLDQNLHFAYADHFRNDDGHGAETLESAKFFRSVFGKNLNAPLTITQRPGSNVLLITIEALGAQAIELGALPKLQEIAKRGMYFKTAVIPSIQTVVGIAALNCAMPYFKPLVVSELTAEVRKWQGQCLPQALSRQGYYTEYMQPTTLSFMGAGTINAIMGFEHSVGGGNLQSLPFPGMTGWGVDDKKLYKAAAERIALASKSGKPWYYQIMTVGTHHPFTVPGDFMPESRMPGQERAFRYADEAVAEFIGWLEANGYLSNTLVIITGDETHPQKNHQQISNELAYHDGTMIILGPNVPQQEITTPVMQTDMAISALDYLGLAELQDTPGRSVFRQYDGFRPLLFGMSAHRTYGAIMRPSVLSFCFGDSNSCGNYTFETATPFDVGWWGIKSNFTDTENKTIRPFF